jgi:hypothetical protein
MPALISSKVFSYKKLIFRISHAISDVWTALFIVEVKQWI